MASTDEGRWLEGIQHPEQHDPLCPESWQPGYYLCICDRLRQAERRGVKAAREAVAALAPTWAVKFYVDRPSNGEWIGCNGAHEQVDVLAAIDALMKEKP